MMPIEVEADAISGTASDTQDVNRTTIETKNGESR